MKLTLHPEFLKRSRRQRYLVGISGGRDSIALLHLLLDHGFHNLILCHLNHGLRGRESGADASFVQRLAKKHGLNFEVTKTDVKRQMEIHGDSMELAARNARHDFFRTCAIQYRCNRLLLAHHADDQAETILFNLLRGSAGLKGIHYHSEHTIKKKHIEFLRPIIHLSRCDIDAYLSNHNIKYREDSTNTQPAAARNRLRNEAIPLLKQIMGRDLCPSLIRAETISKNQEQTLHYFLNEKHLEDPQGRLFLPELKKLPPPAQLTAIHLYLKKHGISDISLKMLERCSDLIDNPSSAKTNLTKNRHFRRKEKRLFID